jgi:hypothetical protein
MPVESITRYTGETPEAAPKVTNSIDTYTAVTDFLKSENGIFNLSEGLEGYCLTSLKLTQTIPLN